MNTMYFTAMVFAGGGALFIATAALDAVFSSKRPDVLAVVIGVGGIAVSAWLLALAAWVEVAR
ncbi:MAG: hypothetical protein NUW01_10350 [Gemmatimonadaceae bacterium]|nr:hypothetical protein [Gemmatimonadaceae bacterium]